MAKQPPWEIKVQCKARTVAEFHVPAHKLQKESLYAFLKAVVVRYRTNTPQEMVGYYLNKTLGLPKRLSLADVKPCHHLDRRRVGYSCGDGDCVAFAMQEVGADVADAATREIERNRNAAL
jgi:hypothetical protein